MDRILVIDDDTAILDSIRILFEVEGFEVMDLHSYSGIQKAIARFKPQVILMDVVVGAVDSRALCKELKGSIHSNIPIILMSVIDDFYSDYLKENHCDGFIKKPFDWNVMVDKINKVISTTQKSD